jgi:hypothetical protein
MRYTIKHKAMNKIAIMPSNAIDFIIITTTGIVEGSLIIAFPIICYIDTAGNGKIKVFILFFLEQIV